MDRWRVDGRSSRDGVSDVLAQARAGGQSTECDDPCRLRRPRSPGLGPRQRAC